MSRFAIVLAGVLCLSGVQVRGEEEVPQEISRHNFGIGAGFVTGYGLSYRHWFPNRNGVQFTVGPYYKSVDDERYLVSSLGVTGLRALALAKYTNLFGYYGVHWHYTRDEYFETQWAPSGATRQTAVISQDHRIIAGLGPGIDIHFWRISINLMFGLAAYTHVDRSFELNLSGETGLYYRF